MLTLKEAQDEFRECRTRYEARIAAGLPAHALRHAMEAAAWRVEMAHEREGGKGRVINTPTLGDVLSLKRR